MASAGRMTGDFIAACSAGLCHNVHAKYSSLGWCAYMCVRAQRTEGNWGRLCLRQGDHGQKLFIDTIGTLGMEVSEPVAVKSV